MTRRRTLYLAAGLLLSLCAVCLAVHCFVGTEAERAYDRIEIGMRQDEVERAIGKPLISETPFAFRPPYGERFVGTIGNPSRTILWEWPGHTVVISYDADDKVSYYGIIYHEPRLWDRLQRLIGL